MGLFGHYITKKGLEQLKRYKYCSAGSTPTDRLLNIWWDFAATLVPLWVAPNVLTLCGFFSIVAAFLLAITYSPSLVEVAPPWVYFTIAAFLFAYQTLDAIDGKHARRTGTSSPLGQLFDHGCDVMVVTVVAVTCLAVTGAGCGIVQYMVVLVSTQLHQYVYMWWEYHFHVFYCSTGVIGVTEGQIGMISLSIAAGIFGPSEFFGFDFLSLLPTAASNGFRSITFAPDRVTVRDVLIWWLIIMNLMVALWNMAVGIIKAEGKSLATAQLGCFAAFAYCQWKFYEACLLDDLVVPSVLVYFVMTTSYSILLIRLCLSSTCKMFFSPLQWPTLPFSVASILLSSSSGVAPAGWRIVVILLVSLWNTVYLSDLLFTSTQDICRSLEIQCFTITPCDSLKKRK